MSSLNSSGLRDVLNKLGWGLLILEIILAIVVTGITGSANTGFRNNLHCSAPSQLNYNLAVAIITFIVLPILTFLHTCAGGSSRPWVRLSWKWWLGIFAVFTILWAAAIGTSFYTCSDLCDACAQIGPSWVQYAGKCCNCAGVDGTTQDFCSNLSGSDGIVIGFERVHGWYLSTQVLDIIVFVMFFVSGAGVVLLHQLRVRSVQGVGEGRIPMTDQGPPPAYMSTNK